MFTIAQFHDPVTCHHSLETEQWSNTPQKNTGHLQISASSTRYESELLACYYTYAIDKLRERTKTKAPKNFTRTCFTTAICKLVTCSVLLFELKKQQKLHRNLKTFLNFQAMRKKKVEFAQTRILWTTWKTKIRVKPILKGRIQGICRSCKNRRTNATASFTLCLDSVFLPNEVVQHDSLESYFE